MIAGLVLAAGSARRMGHPKLLLELGGRPLIRRTVETALASDLDQVVVVTGPHRAEIARALAGTKARLVENPDHIVGMSSSLGAGLRSLGPEVEAIVVVLADQPFQEPGIVNELIATYRATGKQIVVPLYGGRRGNPVLFDRSLFPELAAQQGDQGGRQVIAEDPSRVATVAFETDQYQIDLDTWDDYLAARAALGEC